MGYIVSLPRLQTHMLSFNSGLPACEGKTQNDATSSLHALTPNGSCTHPPLPASNPHLAAIEVNIRGLKIRQVALPATWMYLSLDPWRP